MMKTNGLSCKIIQKHISQNIYCMDSYSKYPKKSKKNKIYFSKLIFENQNLSDDTFLKKYLFQFLPNNAILQSCTRSHGI